MKLLKSAFVIVIIMLFSYLSSELVGEWYQKIVRESGSYIDARSLIGLPLAYIFFSTFLFTIFGGEKKYWWIGILLIPAGIFEMYFDFSHIYFPVVLGVAGWLLGFTVEKILKNSRWI